MKAYTVYRFDYIRQEREAVGKLLASSSPPILPLQRIRTIKEPMR